jgi:hypothetical protein
LRLINSILRSVLRRLLRRLLRGVLRGVGVGEGLLGIFEVTERVRAVIFRGDAARGGLPLHLFWGRTSHVDQTLGRRVGDINLIHLFLEGVKLRTGCILRST